MNFELKVIDIDSRLDITGRFSQVPRCDIQLHSEVIGKIGINDGDLIEVKGKRMTAGRVVSVNKDGFDMTFIGLNNLVRNNAQVSVQEMVAIGNVVKNFANKIVLAPIEKHLRKSELIKGLAKKSFMGMPFVEGDVTYLRSKMLSYILGSITWLRVIKTDPSGAVVVGEETDFEIIPDPVNQGLGGSAYYLPDFSEDDDFSEKAILLADQEWDKLNILLEIGLFTNLGEALTFFLREGIKSRNDIFEKSEVVKDQISQLKKNVMKLS